MRKISIILISFLLFASGFTQAQKVKYPTRKGIVQESTMIMDKNGKPKKKPLAGVRIFTGKGVSNSSNAKGEFTLTPDTVPFKITQVKKNEYTLLSPEQGTRTYQDNNEILDVLMVSTKTLNNYMDSQMEIARLAREKEKNKALKELQKKKDDGDISYGEYFQKEDSINQSYKEKMERMIDYTERSSKEFFKGMEQIDKQIDDCIIKGEIDKADSLIISKGYFNERIVNIEKLDETKIKLVEDAVSDCWKKFEISRDRINYDEALAYLDTARVLQEKHFGLQNPDLVVIYNGIGLLSYAKGNLNEALNWYNKAMKIEEQLLDSLNTDLATIYCNIGVVYDDKGNMEEAMKYYKKALVIQEQVSNPLSNSLSILYNNIGVIYKNRGELNEALKWLDKAMKIAEQVLSPLSPDLATTYNNIGAMYSYRGEYDESLNWRKKALLIQEQVLNPLSPDLATTYNNIGTTYYLKGDLDEAFKWHNKALLIREQVLDSLSPDLAGSYSNLGALYSEKGDNDNALKFYNKALLIQEKVLDSLSMDLATSYGNIGYSYLMLCNYDEALNWQMKALDILKIISEPLSIDLSANYATIAEIYKEKKDYKEALRWFNNSLDILIEVLGKEHKFSKSIIKKVEECKQALGE